MAKGAGRDVLLKIGGTVIAGMRTKSISVSGTPIDVTDDDDAAFTTSLAGVFAEESLEITGSGLEDGSVLRDLALDTDPSVRHLSDLTFHFTQTPADSIAGTFIMTSFSITGEYKDSATFDVTFVRSGAHTFTQGV